MNAKIRKCTGMYIAYPTSSVPKSIYRAKHYKTQVNDQHTKVGITKRSFESSERRYTTNFDGEVKFIPLYLIDCDHLEKTEKIVLGAICKHFKKVGRSREWFNTNNRRKVKRIIFETLQENRLRLEPASGKS